MPDPARVRGEGRTSPAAMRRRLDRGLSRPMSLLALLFLVPVAGAIPQLGEHHISDGIVWACEVGVCAIWLAFWLEFFLRVLYVDAGVYVWRRVGRILLPALVPPLRIGMAPTTGRRCVWIPGLGWRRRGRGLQRYLERAFSGPMMVIALLILPVLGLEFLSSKQDEPERWLIITLDVATRLIWLAFAIEFAVSLAATARKVSYCSRHWVDLAIILLPLIAFLRILRLARLGSLVRTSRLGRLARTYRLRGLAMRAIRALLLLKVVERFSPWTAERRLASLRTAIARKREEIEELEDEITEVRQRLSDRRQAIARRRRKAMAGPAGDGPPSDGD